MSDCRRTALIPVLMLMLALAAPGMAQMPAAPAATASADAGIAIEPGCRVAQASLAAPQGSSGAALAFFRIEPTRRSAVCSRKGWQGARVTAGGVAPLELSFLPEGAADLEVAALRGAGGRSVLVWSAAEGGVGGALLSSAGTREKIFEVMPALGGEAHQPWALPRKDGGFVVLFQSNFFSGSRQSAAWRSFDAQGEPVGEAAPGFPDFLSIPESVGGLAPDGTLLIGGWGQGPASYGFFLQAASAAGDPLGEPTHLKTAGEVTEAALSWSVDADAFLIAYAAKGRGFVRRLGKDGRPLGAEVELGPSRLAPRIEGRRALTVEARGDDRYRVVERVLSGLAETLAAGSPAAVAEGAASSPLLRTAEGWLLFSLDDRLHVRPAADAPSDALR